MRFLIFVLMGLALAGCGGDKKSATSPGAPGAPGTPGTANVVLSSSQHLQAGTWCGMTWKVQNVGSGAAYHVSIQASTGTYGGSYTIQPQETVTIASGMIPLNCPVLQRINWSAQE